MRKRFSIDDPLYFTSDQHFGHGGVIKFCERPFRDVDEMDDALIERFNATVPADGYVFILGDFSFRPNERTLEIITQLNGFKALILGNHDVGLSAYACDAFEMGVSHYHELRVDLHKLVLCHFPFASWNAMHHGAWNLHGHCHGGMSKHPVNHHPRRVDVGVDCWEYRPIHIREVIYGEATP